MARTRITVALVLCLAGGALSLILLSKHYGVPLLGEAALAACGEDGGCDVVSQSRYAKLFGVPLAAFGLFFYGSLIALLLPAVFARNEEGVVRTDGAASLGFHLAAAAIGLDLILLGLQAFSIDAYCKFCIATYGVNLFVAALLWPFRGWAGVRWIASPESRRDVVAWVVATVAVAAAALSLDMALVDRKALAGSSILGIPLSLRAPEKVETGSLAEQLQAAQAEARQWKDTLDDETKLQTYLNEKAKTDFNESEVLKVDVSRSPLQGPANAPIVTITYSDFMCPFCRDLALGLRNYLPTSGNQVKLYYKHFPLDMACNSGIGRTVHPGACELALGGICAQESGRFAEFHDKVFSQAWEKATREDVLNLGVSVGLERSRLNSCMDALPTRGRLAKDVEEGWRVGVASTPTILVNGRKLKSAGVFLLAVDEERKRLKLPSVGEKAAPPGR